MDTVNLILKQRQIFAKVTLGRKFRHKWTGVVTFIVLLFVLTLAVRAIDAFEANASGLVVVNPSTSAETVTFALYYLKDGVPTNSFSIASHEGVLLMNMDVQPGANLSMGTISNATWR